VVHLAAPVLAPRPAGAPRVPPRLDPLDPVPHRGHRGRRRVRVHTRHRDAADEGAARSPSFLAATVVAGCSQKDRRC
jgi:hypothetical protein